MIFLLYWPLRLFIRPHTIPSTLSEELHIDPTKPTLYILHTDSLSDHVALSISAKKLGLASPFQSLQLTASEHIHSCLSLHAPKPLFGKHKTSKQRMEQQIVKLFHTHRSAPELDLQIVPVYITWGRAPDKSKPGFSDVIVDVASPSWLRKLFIILFLGRDSFVSFSRSVSSQHMAEQHGSDAQIARKLIRVIGTHFQRKRQGLTGPTLLERQTLHSAVIGSDSVKRAIEELVDTKGKSKTEAKREAHDYLNEIAADYREGLVRAADRILTPIWNKIYNGISVGNAAKVRELSQNGHEIVYVPCHRSHMDYLLLTYVIYKEGLVTPHIAAGINLNFWPAGPIFRKAGAFFLRRSFAGNKLYTAVFREYLELLFNKGYSVKYYPEGGRSRTGRLLPPKTGMLAMTVQAMTKGINRPVSIVPVYIGYENVMEVGSYVKELKGKSKSKESPLQVLGALKKLRNYGHGYLNFGEPIQLNKFLDQHAPSWSKDKNADPDRKPLWLSSAVNRLADDIMLEINKSGALNGMALTSLCLLSSKMYTMGEKDLSQVLDDYLNFFRALPFSDTATVPDINGATMVQQTLALKRLNITKDNFGTLISPQDGKAVVLTYYRNNIIHQFALPGLIMSLVFALNGSDKKTLKQHVNVIYPLLQKELFLHHNEEAVDVLVDAIIEQFKIQGLLIYAGKKWLPPATGSVQYNSAWILSRVLQETFQRYAVVLQQLGRSSTMSRGDLERGSRKVAERLSSMFGVSSPEFSDKNVFATLINGLRENGLVTSNESGSLALNAASAELSEIVNILVWPEIVQHLENLEIT
jgi:glycerol-3-phosphate O-acyltransferase